MVKILSRSGFSLADLYDVQGSIAGIDELESKEVTLIHELGSTIFSERLSGFIRRVSTGAIAQNITFAAEITGLPGGITRIAALQMFVDADRLTSCLCVVRDEVAGRDMPISIWDGTNLDNVPFDDDGAGVGTHALLRPLASPQVPSMLIGGGQPQRVDRVFLRGLTSGFGAGDVTVVLILYVVFTQIGPGVSNTGLPVPSW